MVDIQSKEVIDKISDELKIQPSMQIPRELSKNIQLIYNVNPLNRVQRVIEGFANGSGGVTILTTSSEKDTFLTSISFGVNKDTLSDIATGRLGLTVIINGDIVRIMQIPVITLTEQNIQINKHFSIPIKLDRNSNISFSADTFTVGVMLRSSEVTLFETDPQ